jgi:hypothetical protein
MHINSDAALTDQQQTVSKANQNESIFTRSMQMPKIPSKNQFAQIEIDQL